MMQREEGKYLLKPAAGKSANGRSSRQKRQRESVAQEQAPSEAELGGTGIISCTRVRPRNLQNGSLIGSTRLPHQSPEWCEVVPELASRFRACPPFVPTPVPRGSVPRSPAALSSCFFTAANAAFRLGDSLSLLLGNLRCGGDSSSWLYWSLGCGFSGWERCMPESQGFVISLPN